MTPKHIDHYVDHTRIALCGIPGDNIEHFSLVTARFALDQHPELADEFCSTCLKAFQGLK